MENDAHRFGRLAYDAYRQSTGGVSLITGDALPDFDSLPVPVQDAWMAAAAAARAASAQQGPPA